MSAAAADHRVFRRFDVEDDRRNRRLFVVMASAFALVAVVGGIVAALLVLRDQPEPPEIAGAAHAGLPIYQPEPIPPIEPKAAPEPEPEPPPKPERLTQSKVRGGLRGLQPHFDACARKHGGLEGTVVRVDFSVEPSGRVHRSFARPPYDRTPVGRCVAAVVVEHGRFGASRRGYADYRGEVTLHPDP